MGESRVKVNFYATFRPLVGGKTIEAPLRDGSTLQELLQTLAAEYPLLRPALLDQSGSLFDHVHVFVNGREAKYHTQALDTPLKEGDIVDIFPPVGGGASKS